MLKELEDYNWFPPLFRRFQAEYIGSIVKWFHIYLPLVPVLRDLLINSKSSRVQDLCSGSGLPSVCLHHDIQPGFPWILSDKFPPPNYYFKEDLFYLSGSSDILQLEPVKDTCYTLFNAFHHFTNHEQQHIIHRFISAGSPFLIAEILEPGILNLLKIFFTTTVLQLLLAPFVQPFSLLRLFFTWLVPLNLFTVCYDGLVSVIKSKKLHQYRSLLEGYSNPAYRISINRISNWKGGLIYLKGHPIYK